MWGRIKLVREAVQAGAALTMGDVMAFNAREVMSTEQYSWCWAMCNFLDSHLLLQQRFRQLQDYADQENFDTQFRKLYARDWKDLQFEWQTYLAELDYGYDVRRMTITHLPAAVVEKQSTVQVTADRGWQSSGWKLQAGKSYRVTAAGRYQIAKGSEPWPCEPGGVTIRYHQGRPLGMLLGLIRSEEGYQEPIGIGLGATLKPEQDAVLYLRVNDSPGWLEDNLGSLEVTIERN